MLLRHVLRVSLIPIVSLWGLDFAAVIGGATIVVESVFQYSGVGIAMRDAVLNRDFPTAQVITMILTAVYVVTNLAADIATILVTPRLRTRLQAGAP